ncbi:MAG: hypothetical protein M1828_004082 [Chrysothrix sp. TS-e1954]|nr:MAG: hypothetical protein M1828_004082 [Chrysothrix sp. TS-e1954]
MSRKFVRTDKPAMQPEHEGLQAVPQASEHEGLQVEHGTNAPTSYYNPNPSSLSPKYSDLNALPQNSRHNSIHPSHNYSHGHAFHTTGDPRAAVAPTYAGQDTSYPSSAANEKALSDPDRSSDGLYHFGKTKFWLIVALVLLVAAGLGGGLGGGLGARGCSSNSSSTNSTPTPTNLTPTFTEPAASLIATLSPTICPSQNLATISAGQYLSSPSDFLIHCSADINSVSPSQDTGDGQVSILASVRALSLEDCLEDCLNWNTHWSNTNCWMKDGAKGSITDAAPDHLVAVLQPS